MTVTRGSDAPARWLRSPAAATWDASRRRVSAPFADGAVSPGPYATRARVGRTGSGRAACGAAGAVYTGVVSVGTEVISTPCMGSPAEERAFTVEVAAAVELFPDEGAAGSGRSTGRGPSWVPARSTGRASRQSATVGLVRVSRESTSVGTATPASSLPDRSAGNGLHHTPRPNRWAITSATPGAGPPSPVSIRRTGTASSFRLNSTSAASSSANSAAVTS